MQSCEVAEKVAENPSQVAEKQGEVAEKVAETRGKYTEKVAEKLTKMEERMVALIQGERIVLGGREGRDGVRPICHRG